MKYSNVSPILSLGVLLLIIIGGCAAQQTLWDVHVQQKEKIIADSTKELERNSRDAVSYYNRGEAYLLIQQYEKAILDFNQAIQINPKYARAYEGRADANSCLKRLDAAESDLKKAEEIDPTIFDDDKNRGLGYISDVTNEFIFPAVDLGKRHREGDLILGSTTMKQAVKMLPQWPGHGPIRISQDQIKPQPGKVGEVLQNARYSYNPMVAGDHILGFNKNKRLVIIHVYLPSYYSESKEGKKNQEKIRNMMKQYQFEEVSRNEDTITMRREIMPCITVLVFDPIADEKPITTIEYFFTCPTK